MTTLLRRSGRVVARGLELLLGLVGGLLWAFVASLVLVYLYRIDWLAGLTMAVAIGACCGGFGLAGVLWRRRFALYVLPLLEVVFSDESATAGWKASGREVIVAVAILVALVSLTLGAVLISSLAVAVGVVAAIVYASLTPGVAKKAEDANNRQ